MTCNKKPHPPGAGRMALPPPNAVTLNIGGQKVRAVSAAGVRLYAGRDVFDRNGRGGAIEEVRNGVAHLVNRGERWCALIEDLYVRA